MDEAVLQTIAVLARTLIYPLSGYQWLVAFRARG